MSSVAQQERWQTIPTAWASRLIPGSGISGHLRKKPRGVDVDLREATGQAPKQKNDERSLSELILPDPIAVAGRWRLGWEIAGDGAATLVIWPAITATALVMATQAQTSLASAHFLALIARSAGFALVFAALVTLLGHSEGLYGEGLPRAGIRLEWILAKSVAWATLIVGVASSLSGWTIVPRAWLATGAALNFIGLTGRRQWSMRQKRRVCKSKPLNVLIVGAGPSGRAVEHHLNQHPELGRVVRGFVDDSRDFGVLGPIGDLPRLARTHFADELIVVESKTIQKAEPDFIEHIVNEARAHRLDVRLVPEFAELGPKSSFIETWGNIPVVAVHRESLPDAELVLKRVVDIAASSIALMLLAPVLALISLWILADSGLPILYPSERVGRKGRQFRCFKFRTMSRDADTMRDQLRAQNERRGPCFKIADDPRITRSGRFLRRYSFDELPQLYNVLRGEMSLVGPRPHPPDDFARYEFQHLRRLDVTPGITGLWQVTARQEASFEANLALDLEYIERWNFWLDLQILWRTLGVVLRGTGT